MSLTRTYTAILSSSTDLPAQNVFHVTSCKRSMFNQPRVSADAATGRARSAVTISALGPTTWSRPAHGKLMEAVASKDDG